MTSYITEYGKPAAIMYVVRTKAAAVNSIYQLFA